ncbi:hypothetical protein SDC9_142345 [bioreactor metagenome]|uniref:Uncharacterized protein n=1 Tax=bioreactor metagenome TaxID=1076179 RepID=A0A645E3P5_9ZZZZ
MGRIKIAGEGAADAGLQGNDIGRILEQVGHIEQCKTTGFGPVHRRLLFFRQCLRRGKSRHSQTGRRRQHQHPFVQLHHFTVLS